MKDVKRLARRATAVLIALIMASAYVPQLGTQLQANFVNMTVSLSGALVAGGEVGPRFVEGAALEGQATVSWDIPGVGLMDRLVFPIRRWVPQVFFPFPGGGYYDYDIVVMHVLRWGENEMWVEYRVFNHANADMNFFFGNDVATHLWNNFRINYGTLGPSNDYRYLLHDHEYWVEHMNRIEPTVPGDFNPNRIASAWRNLETSLVANDRRFGGPLHLVNDPLLVPPLPPVDYGLPQQPFFRVQRGGGFSFSLQPGTHVDQSAAHAVHFVWDDEVNPAGNTFIVTTGGLQKGAFYDFTLSRTSPAVFPNIEAVLTAADLPWPALATPPGFPPGPLQLHHVQTQTIAVQTAFTGFVMSALPLAEHREEPQGGPFTLNRPGFFDQLWWHPIAPWGPPNFIPRDADVDPYLRGFTNWDLAPAARPTTPAVMDPLWNPWNILDHTHPTHTDENDFLPGFAGTRAIDIQPELEPSRGYPSNMIRLRVEVPYQFYIVGTNPFGDNIWEWVRITDPVIALADRDFINAISQMEFNFNIDLLVPPNIPSSFSYDDIFGTPSRADNGSPPFIPIDNTRWREYPRTIPGPPQLRTATDFYIRGLEPSRIFPHFNMSLTPPNMAILRTVADVVAGDSFGGGGVFPVADAHTFLEFDVVFIGGRFHVRIFPYLDAHGDYTVISNSYITAPHRSSGRDVIFIPLLPAPTSYIQVRFEPSMPSSLSDIYSQVMAFRPVSDRHIFTEPANFVLRPDNPVLTFIEPSNVNEAIFSVDVGWDLATVSQLNAYFNEVNAIRGPLNTFGPGPAPWSPPHNAILIDATNPDHDQYILDGAVPGEWMLPYNELTFTYVLHSRLSPFESEGQPFLIVDLVVRRIPANTITGAPARFEWVPHLRDYIDPSVLQVLAPAPPINDVAIPTDIFITKPGLYQHSVTILDQFGIVYTPSGGVNVTWAISNISGGGASINTATGVVTPDNAALPPTSYTVTATVELVNEGVTLARQLVVTNPTTLSIPTGITIPPASQHDTVFRGSTVTFTAEVANTATALQAVRWEVTDAPVGGQPVPGARISRHGVLFVSQDVAPGTMLYVRAITYSMGSAFATPAVPVRVAVGERSIAITTVTENDMIRIGIGRDGEVNGDVRLNMIASRQGVTIPPLPHFFQFPEIYHITAQLFDINASQSGHQPITPPLPESNSQPMTLDLPVDLDFPPPQNLRAWVTEADELDPDIEGGFFDMAFDVPLARIRHYMDTSPRRGADTDITIRVFISESQQAIQNITALGGAARAGAATNIPVTAIANGSPQILEPFSANSNLEALRNNTVVYFDMPLSPALLHSDQVTLEQMFKLHGLDRNTQYFITMDAFIDWDTFPSHTSHSTTTNIAGVTTMGDLVPPDPGGMRPSAPQDLRVDDITVASADLSWLPVPPLAAEGGQIRYQIIRMRADHLPNDLLDNHGYSMTQVLARISALGLSAPEAVLITYGEDVVHNYATGAVAPGFSLRHGTLTDDPADTEERVILVDTNLSPNTLYFYYVRTVWHTPAGMTYSAWVGVSVTTSLVDPPENLRIELAPWIGGALWQDFDPRFQFVIRFDAPVGTLEGHGTLYDFQYTLMTGDSTLWEPHIRLTTAMQLERIPTPGREGFYQFTYLISNLQPGTQYSIRVRTMDLVNGDYSMYSNIATTRTDTDQDAVNRERDLANLHQYLRDLIREFIRQHHWTAQDAQNTFVAVYRPSMINNLLETNGSMIRLAMTGQDTNVYYLPQALFLQTWRNERGFIIAKGDTEIAIPSHAFNMIDSEAILQAMQRVRDVPGVLDYYVRITAVMRPHAPNVQIHGRQPGGYEVVLRFEVVEANMTAAQLDDDILTVLTHRLDTDFYTLPFIEEITQMLDREESFEDMVRRLHQMADSITNQMAAYVNSQLLPTLDRVYEVNYVSQPVTVRLINQPTTAVVNGFRFAGTNWVQQEVNIQGGARAMRTSGPGAFAFNIQNLNLPGVTQMQGNETLTALFVRYGLHDFLGTDATFNLQNNITLSQVQGIAARLAGAPQTANPQNWLRGRGYIVPVRGANSPATTQEAIYTLMAVYEIRSNTNLSTLRIGNFNAASGINGIDARFRPAIQAAFELNLYTNANMNPTAPISIEDVLRMILAINQRVTL